MAEDDVTAYLVDSWSPATEREVTRFEDSIESKLPDAYRSFVLDRNGGRFAITVRHVPRKNESHRAGAVDIAIREMFSLNCPEELSWRDIAKVWRTHERRIPASTVPIGTTGEDLILIHTKHGRVSYWERDKEMHLAAEDNQVRLAPDFKTFLGELQVEGIDERRRNSLERDEPFVSIEAHDSQGYDQWLRQTNMKGLSVEFRHKLFKIACDTGNARVAGQLLKGGVIDPKSKEVCRLADEAGWGEIVLTLMKSGAEPSDFTIGGYRPQGYTLAFIRAWKSGQLR